MSKPKHTPAPWRVADQIIMSEGNEWIADMSLYGGDEDRTYEDFEQRMKANARLIAAAPELLDLVEDLLIAYKLGYWEGDDLKPKADALLKRIEEEA